jgi:magnesium chelatase accessory protein
MMANWQLEGLGARLGNVASPVLLISAAKDAAIPKTAVMQAAALIPGCETLEMAALGHLAHEEDPAEAVKIITEFAKAKITA